MSPIFLLFVPTVLSFTLSERVEELDEKSLELVAKAKTAKKLTKELRIDLITFFLEFVQLHQEVIENGEPLLLFKVSRIAARLRAGLRVRLPSVKKRLSRVVAGLLTPIVAPWVIFEKTQQTTPPPEPLPPVYYPQQYIPTYSRWTVPPPFGFEYPYR